jgi:hypothetical protein
MRQSIIARAGAVVIAVAGLLAVAGYLSERGFRITKTPVAGQPDQVRLPGAQSSEQQLQPRRATVDATQRGRGGRNVEKQATVFLGITPIPLVVNGRESAVLVGSELEAQLAEITISSKHHVRTGWSVANILQAHGIRQAKEVVFTDKDGQRLTTTWGQIMDTQYPLIVAYGRNDTMLLFSGPELAPNQKLTRKEALALLPTGVDLVLFPNVVKIEVQA